jgi:hypothetical protein
LFLTKKAVSGGGHSYFTDKKNGKDMAKKKMKYRFILIWLILIPFCSWAQLNKQTLYTVYQEAALACNEKNFTKAEDLLSEVITSSNEFSSNWLYANCLLANNKIEEAKPIILKVLNHNRFEKKWIAGFGFDKVKEHTISLWIDSICATIPEKSIPMIDSLAIMVKIDQEVRQAYQQPYKTKATVDSLIKLMLYTDSINTDKLKKLIGQYGFPTWKLLGEKGSHNAWLIAQHANLEFQEWYLLYIQQAVDEDNASTRNLAYLIDRIRIKKKQPQLYGTQMWSNGTYQPIEDIENLNNRRASMYLEPMNIETMEVAKSF